MSGTSWRARAARHARAIEIRQQVGGLAGALADAASGQQALFTPPGTARRARPAGAARMLHRLIAELAALAADATARNASRFAAPRTARRRPRHCSTSRAEPEMTPAGRPSRVAGPGIQTVPITNCAVNLTNRQAVTALAAVDLPEVGL